MAGILFFPRQNSKTNDTVGVLGAGETNPRDVTLKFGVRDGLLSAPSDRDGYNFILIESLGRRP